MSGGFELTGAALDERDEFTEQMVPSMIGACARDTEGLGNWCETHEAHWPPEMEVCTHARDMEDFADRMIEAWEGRAGRGGRDGLGPVDAYRTGSVYGLLMRVGLTVRPVIEDGDLTDVIVIEDGAQEYRVQVLPYVAADASEEVQDERA